MRDWFAFLRQHSIPYTTTGPNASRGRVNVKCPFCGPADPSEHMGINLNDKGWSCWRNASHRGREAPRLIGALLKCSPAEAERINGEGAVALPSDSDLGAELRKRLGGEEPEVARVTQLSLPKEFYPLTDGSRWSDAFIDYLMSRGYTEARAWWLADTYNLQYAKSGRFAYRLIIPIYDRWRNLQTWTGRAIYPEEELRYRSLKREEQVCSPKETLLGLPLLWECPNPKLLVICEGPFDAFWVTTFGRPIGIYGTCLFGLSMSDAQATLLLELKERFRHQTLLLDSAARMQAFKMAGNGLGLTYTPLPEDVKDPGEMPADRLVLFLFDLLPVDAWL